MSFTVGDKYRYEGELNAAGEVTRVRTWIDNPVLGDTLLETEFSDYQAFGAVRFPRHIARNLGGHPVLELEGERGDGRARRRLRAPANLAPAAAPEVKVTKLDDGVFYLTGGTHHSVLVEQDDHLVIVEAPQNEARSLAVIAKAKEIAPGKPIRYLVNTHAHFDHSGGLRTYVDEGAIIVTDAGNRAFYEQAWAAPRTINPDRAGAVGQGGAFRDLQRQTRARRPPPRRSAHHRRQRPQRRVLAGLSTGARRFSSRPMPTTPGALGAPAPAPPNPYTVNLADNLKRWVSRWRRSPRCMDPRVATFEDLRTAAGLVHAGPADYQRRGEGATFRAW